MAKLHSVDYRTIGLEDFGQANGYYPRQIRSLLKISAMQTTAKDENGNPVGPIPRVNEMTAWFKRNLISDETCIVHGDFKVLYSPVLYNFTILNDISF